MAEPSRTLTLTGKPTSLDWPKLCVACVAPASSHTTLSRVDSYDDDGTTRYSVTRLRVPVCAGCLSRHHAEGKFWSPLARLLLCFRSFFIIAVIGASVMFYLFAPAFFRNLFQTDLIGMLAFSGVLAFFAAIALGSLRAAWNETERFAISPPTTVSRAVYWSTDISAMFEAERHQYTFTNPQFAETMLVANRNRVWSPTSPVARDAAAKRKIVKYLLISTATIIVVIALLKENGCTGIHMF